MLGKREEIEKYLRSFGWYCVRENKYIIKYRKPTKNGYSYIIINLEYHIINCYNIDEVYNIHVPTINYKEWGAISKILDILKYEKKNKWKT